VGNQALHNKQTKICREKGKVESLNATESSVGNEPGVNRETADEAANWGMRPANMKRSEQKRGHKITGSRNGN